MKKFNVENDIVSPLIDLRNVKGNLFKELNLDNVFLNPNLNMTLFSDFGFNNKIKVADNKMVKPFMQLDDNVKKDREVYENESKTDWK